MSASKDPIPTKSHLKRLQRNKGRILPQVSFLIPCKGSSEFLEETVQTIDAYLKDRFLPNYEIILIPNPASEPNFSLLSEADRDNYVLARKIASSHSRVRCVPHEFPRGKYAALKTGLSAASGEWIFFTDADLPFDLEFFDEAIDAMLDGCDLVMGNRRKSDSRSVVPPKLLGRFLLRDILSRTFSLVSRAIIPSIRFKDTQAGIKAMSRDFADLAFERMTCPGFFGDIELLLVAKGLRARVTDLPVTLYVNDNKTSVRFVRDAFSALSWLFKIRTRELRGLYTPESTIGATSPAMALRAESRR